MSTGNDNPRRQDYSAADSQVNDMSGMNKNGMQCSEFDLLLADAIDGLLSGEKLARFEQHRGSCPACATMFADASAGFGWLQQLDEVEAPKQLAHNILAATTSERVATIAAQAAEEAKKPWLQRVKDGFRPVFAPVFTTRFAMSAAMAFFSISTVMSVSPYKLSDLRRFDLSPKGISRTYYATEAKAVKYYENIRLVYEIESRVRELRKAAGTESDDQNNRKNQNDKSKQNTEEPDKEYRNYSRGQDELTLASVEVERVIGTLTGQRRLS